ncbi:MAG: hypothetical protein Q8882_01630 [Bacillota bacterium]|nr:hypothetical protein [Bacillota bacterium]
MKTARMIIGIISMVLFVLIVFQSCAAGVGNALSENGEVSGSAGFILSVFMLIAGIIGVVARKSKGGSITAGIFYLVGGLLAIVSAGSYSDLKVWSVIAFAFGIFFIISAILPKKPKTENKVVK